ncbi:MAG TPA: OmpA family protein [Rhodocyclaceae bacterium]|nr:OmpA family protein [Rhodocyclaceae bacterium]
MMNFQRTTLALALGLLFSGAQAQQSLDANTDGKRIDNGRVDFHVLPSPGELEPAVPYPLPSGVSRGDVAVMKATSGALPATPATVRQSMSDSLTGALFVSGKAFLTDESKAILDKLVADLKGKQNLKISVVGHTDNQRLSPRAKKIFTDNQGLSEARSLAVASYLKDALGLRSDQVAIQGFGESRPLADNGNLQGMAKNRRVELAIWYDAAGAAAALQAPQATRAACAQDAASRSDLPFRITVDGEAIDTGAPQEADRQRCVDVALEKADIQVRYDSLAIAPALNIWATPNGAVRGQPVEFRAWSNYIPWLKKAELRIFRRGQKPQETPLEVVPIGWTAPTQWTPPAEGPDDEVFYLLRVYDGEGRFDESSLKPLTLLVRPKAGFDDKDKAEREKLAGYGENSLVLRNIPIKGGTVTVNGSALKPGQHVESLGLDLPVDASGKFAIKQILPAGPHTVEVKVSNPDGSAVTFRRNLSIPADDWFLLAVGDLTVGHNNVSGPASLVTGDNQHYADKVYVDGRGAFYLKGKIKGEYLLTASADTTEQPVNQMFTNFSAKDPRYLLRNINPDLYYPVYGDDSTTVDDAPTQGKFFVKLEKGDSHVMWGNFQTSWSGTELLQYSRGLYGAKGRYRSEDTTAYGEKRTQVDAFAADPGTVASREEFRGTGGSLYYLRHQDITLGSERVWVEIRDKDSGLVIERKQLVAAQDYEVNYLQGRIALRDGLSSLGSSSGLVFSSTVNGNPQYLVVTYEYAPGLTAVSNLSTGIRANQWINDNLAVGGTLYHQGESGASQSLGGVDATFRKNPNTYVKVEAARSSGVGNGVSSSQDGGFGFNSISSTGRNAEAYRVDAAADLADVADGAKGRISAYVQNRGQGFSAPGQLVSGSEAVKQEGGRAEWQVAENTRVEAKGDVRNAATMDSKNLEVAVRQKLDDEWTVSGGLRRDERQNQIANASPTLSQNGGRTDVQVRADYAPNKDNGKPGEKEDWNTYGFVQGTVARDGNRSENDRVGAGAGWRINDRLKLNTEASGGSLGPGGKVGADYRLSDRSNAYVNYVVESENPDSAWRGRQGTWVSGSNYRVSDEVRLFGETKLTHGAGPQSLSQAFGTDWAPNDRWTLGSKVEVGTLSDPLAGDTRRRALGFSVGYKEGKLKYSGNTEFRTEDNNVSGHRNTWLVRNTLGYQATREWRLMGKLNWSDSNNSQGAFYDGGYHEVVAAAAYRPVDNDRWNTLFKYTNFYNLPSPGQLGASGTTADYAQKSQVLAVDTIYDVKPWLSVGGKYALRVGELKASKTDGEWFSSRADLMVLRADWHFVKEWDAMVEWRNLRALEARDARAGALVAVYRHVAEGVKLGVGYNFTNYSDDLTDLSYRSRGWFLNVLGTF